MEKGQEMNERVEAAYMPQYRDMLQELLNLDDGLSSWECDFVESLSHWDGAFTESQAATLEKLYDKLCYW